MDTSLKAKEYFINLKAQLDTLDKSFKIDLVENLINDNYNLSLFFQKKLNPTDNPTVYNKRWKQLKNSLNAHLLSYKEEQSKEANKDYKIHKGLAKELAMYVKTTDETLCYVIYKKHLPENQPNKLKWLGSKTEAAIFSRYVGLSVYKDFNNCFMLPDGKKLRDGNLSRAQYKDYDILKILEKYIF